MINNKMELYPVKIDCYDEGLPAFMIETFDCETAKVEITAHVSLKEWPAISAKIEEALRMMKLQGDKNEIV